MNITTRRIVLVLLALVLLVLFVMMITSEPASAAVQNLPISHINGSLAGGRLKMLATLFSLGGFVAGGGTVYIYAKATNQKVEWRGVPFIGWCYLHLNRRAERRAA